MNSRSDTLVSLGESTFSLSPSTLKDDTLLDRTYIPGWIICVHPQGWIYFANTFLRVVTDQDIRRPDLLKETHDLCDAYSLSALSDGMEVHISLGHNTTSGSPCGLFNLVINHVHCVASYNIDEVTGDASCSLGPARLNRCRRLYWNYLWNHPVHVPVPPRALTDASDALTWFYTDNLISGPRSTVPFSKTECEELSRVVAELSVTRNDNSIAKTTFLAWLLREICSFRDAESWGQHTQKESQNLRKLRHKPTQPASGIHPLIRYLRNFTVNVLFFGIPRTYEAHVKLTSEYRGRLSNVNQNWRNYVERLVREYSHFLLISTVLLSATVGFLSISDVPEGAKVAATISTFASLGSIIVGVFSIWRHQANTTAADSFTYMHNIQHSFLGLSGHAILLSLPLTLLVWAILLFTTSVVAFVLRGFGAETRTWRQISIWFVMAIFIVLLVIVVIALYTLSIIWKFQRRTVRILNRISNIWTSAVRCVGEIV